MRDMTKRVARVGDLWGDMKAQSLGDALAKLRSA
jgi:hypothetical protein